MLPSGARQPDQVQAGRPARPPQPVPRRHGAGTGPDAVLAPAAGATKVQDPTGGERLAVSAVVSLKAGVHPGLHLRRHLGDSGAFLQLAVSESGQVEECRYFTLLDREMPSDEDAWDVWLNENQGLIGWPQFQTLHGQLDAASGRPDVTC